MKMLLKIVFALGFAAVLCSAQNVAKETPAASGANPSSQAAAPASPAESIPAPAPVQPAVSADDQLPPSRKASTDSKGSSENKAAENKAVDENTAGGADSAAKPYVIGPLDVLIVKVWNNPNLSGPVDVRSDGMLSMPLIGEVRADGSTARQLKDKITGRLSEFLNSPEVDIQVAKVNSKRYFVYGDVLRSGEFPLVEATTIMDALANVGGFRDFANLKKIYVMRGTQKFNFNYKDVSKGKNMEQNILLQNGDRVYVPD